MSEFALRLEGVHTNIAQYHILQGVDLAVPESGVTMLLGRNGVGKSTTLRTIMGLWQASRGQIFLRGAEITPASPSAISRMGVAFVPEDMGIFHELSVEENLTLAAFSGPLDAKRLEWIFTYFPPLQTFWRQPAGNLSGGQKQMLSIARAMVEERQLYLIDEPSKGLAPAIVAALVKALRELKKQGASILLVEQNFSVARALGDTAAVMDDGRIIWSGTMSELTSDNALQEQLMGLKMEML